MSPLPIRLMFDLPLFSIVIMAYLTHSCAGYTYSINFTSCNDSVAMTTEQCSLCFIIDDDQPDQGKLFNYMESGHIVVSENEGVDDGHIVWTYDANVVENPDNITLSLHMWNSQNNLRGQAVPGCCNIPLTSRGCNPDGCIDATVYVSITSGTSTVLGPQHLHGFHSCTDRRSSARYFNICVHQPTEWSTLYNCECVVYDSLEGTLLPGNHSTEVETNRTDLGVWYSSNATMEPIEACQFELPKARVLERGYFINDSSAMDSVVFNRSVYQMPGFNWTNGFVIDTLRDVHFNCTRRLFGGTDMFNVSSAVADNDTFTCMMPWPNGTSKFQPYSRHVKCMPHNPQRNSVVYVMKEEPSPVVSAMVVVIPFFGVVALLLLISLLGYHWKKKVEKFMKETKSVPNELDTVMRSTQPCYMSDQHHECEETCQAFDGAEKERVSSIKRVRERGISHRYLLKDDILPFTSDDLGSSLAPVRASDKRIQRDDEFSDSEDEGEGGRKNQESHQKKKRKLDEGEEGDKPVLKSEDYNGTTAESIASSEGKVKLPPKASADDVTKPSETLDDERNTGKETAKSDASSQSSSVTTSSESNKDTKEEQMEQ